MPKILIITSTAKPKDRKAHTSMQNVKALIEKRVEKDAEDKIYTVTTLNMKMGLKPVVDLINSSAKKLQEHEGLISVETYTVDPSKEKRGRWSIEGVPVEKKIKTDAKEEKPSKKDKKAKEEPAKEEKKSKKDKKKAKKDKKTKE